MDTRTEYTRIQDHIIIKGAAAFPNETSVRLENRSVPMIVTDVVAGLPSRESKDGAVALRLTRMGEGEELLVRMGMSFISSQQACSNAEAEIPTFDFETVSQSSISQFEDLLNRIRVNTTNVPEDILILFYSSVTLTHIHLTCIVVSHAHLTTELYRRKPTLGYQRTNL